MVKFANKLFTNVIIGGAHLKPNKLVNYKQTLIALANGKRLKRNMKSAHFSTTLLKRFSRFMNKTFQGGYETTM